MGFHSMVLEEQDRQAMIYGAVAIVLLVSQLYSRVILRAVDLIDKDACWLGLKKINLGLKGVCFL